MKKLSFKLLAFVTLLALTVVSCIDDEFDSPPINDIPIGSVLNIQNLRDLCPPGNSFSFTSDSSVYAIVTMDEKSGNIYRNVFVQDNTGAVNLRFQASSALYEGDSIRIYLKGAKLSWFNGLFQVDSLHADSSIIKQATNRHVKPEVATIPQLNNSIDYFQSRLIKLEDVQIVAADTSKTWADAANLNYGQVFLEDTLGNTVMVRTSGYAKFADQKVPNGFGSVNAIVGFYQTPTQSTVQLYIRNTDSTEVNLFGPRWEDDSEPPSGSGSFDNPYNVTSAIQNNTGSAKWVEGYLVAVMETNVDPFEPSYSPPFSTNSNVMISDDPNNTNDSQCLIVQLPFGDIRTAVNMVDNPQNHKKKIKLRGNLTAYFGVPGLKDTDGYWLDGDGINPDDDDTPSDAFFEEVFASDLGSFTAHNISGDQFWRWGDFDGGCAVMNGYDGGAKANEDWLVSPEINLSDKVNVVMNIREAINYITSYDDLKVLIATNYNGSSAPTESGDWIEFTDFNRPPGNNWSFVDSGDIDISQFDGETIHIAFKYISTSSGAATWEISKVQLFDNGR